VLGCEVGELLIPEPDKVPSFGQNSSGPDAAVASITGAVPRRRDGRTLPPT